MTRLSVKSMRNSQGVLYAQDTLHFFHHACPRAAATNGDYRVVKTWKLGGDGGWDYLTADSEGHRLFIARATRVMVVDTTTGKQIGEIPDTPGVHGVALAPELGRGFTSNGREDTVSVFNLKTLAVEKKIKVGSGPDAILYDPSRNACLRSMEKGQRRPRRLSMPPKRGRWKSRPWWQARICCNGRKRHGVREHRR